MIPIPASWIVAGVVAVAVGGYVWHCESVKSDRARQDGIAEEQKRQNALIALRQLKQKERADENYERRITRLAADTKRLRERPSILPPSSAPAGSAEAITFDRGKLDDALRAFTGGVSDLVGEGDKAAIGLDEARRWAN